MAIKEVNHNKSFTELDDGLKYRLPDAIDRFKKKHLEQILFYEITQYLFFTQYFRLKKYAAENGVKLIGDIPFYVQLESADVWSNPDIFRLGRDMTPVLVAGVPPDYFSEEGQLWVTRFMIGSTNNQPIMIGGVSDLLITQSFMM